jgi:predicted AAA+ superfamily ATPase
MIDVVQPHSSNTGKRVIKSPKIYISDSGIAATLLGLNSFGQLTGHPVFGTLWEGVILSNIRGHFPGADIRFYRTGHGAEIDFLIILPSKIIAVECKASKAPSLTRGTYGAIADLKPEHTFIVAPVSESYPLRKDISVVSPDELILNLSQYIL